jgi:hypothetical protein
VDYDVIWGVLDVEAGRLKDAVCAILASDYLEPPKAQDSKETPKTKAPS